MAGRKAIISDQVKVQQFLGALRVGATVRLACTHVGWSEGAVYEAIQRGEGTHPTRPQTKAHAEFAEAVKEARDRAELRALTVIANDPSWQSKAWYLERTQPDRYGRRTRLEHSGVPDGPPVTVTVQDQYALDVARVIRDGLAGLPLTPPDDAA